MAKSMGLFSYRFAYCDLAVTGVCDISEYFSISFAQWLDKPIWDHNKIVHDYFAELGVPVANISPLRLNLSWLLSLLDGFRFVLLSLRGLQPHDLAFLESRRLLFNRT